MLCFHLRDPRQRPAGPPTGRRPPSLREARGCTQLLASDTRERPGPPAAPLLPDPSPGPASVTSFEEAAQDEGGRVKLKVGQNGARAPGLTGWPRRAAGWLPVPHAWRVGTVTCPHSLAGRSRGSHGTEQVRVSCDHLRPHEGTWSVEARGLLSAGPPPAAHLCPGRASGLDQGEPAEQQGSGGPHLPPREEPPPAPSANRTRRPEGRPPTPPSAATLASRKPRCSPGSSGHHLVQAPKAEGSGAVWAAARPPWGSGLQRREPRTTPGAGGQSSGTVNVDQGRLRPESRVHREQSCGSPTAMTPEMFTVPHVTQNIPHEGEEFIKSAEGRKRSGAHSAKSPSCPPRMCDQGQH